MKQARSRISSTDPSRDEKMFATYVQDNVRTYDNWERIVSRSYNNAVLGGQLNPHSGVGMSLGEAYTMLNKVQSSYDEVQDIPEKYFGVDWNKETQEMGFSHDRVNFLLRHQLAKETIQAYIRGITPRDLLQEQVDARERLKSMIQDF